MASELREREAEPKPRRSWDYSSDPLKGGGMQILAVAVACVVFVVAVAVGLLYLWLSPHLSGPAR